MVREVEGAHETSTIRDGHWGIPVGHHFSLEEDHSLAQGSPYLVMAISMKIRQPLILFGGVPVPDHRDQMRTQETLRPQFHLVGVVPRPEA